MKWRVAAMAVQNEQIRAAGNADYSRNAGPVVVGWRQVCRPARSVSATSGDYRPLDRLDEIAVSGRLLHILFHARGEHFVFARHVAVTGA